MAGTAPPPFPVAPRSPEGGRSREGAPEAAPTEAEMAPTPGTIARHHRPASPSAPGAASTAVPGEGRREGENAVSPLRLLITFAVWWAQPFRQKVGKESSKCSHWLRFLISQYPLCSLWPSLSKNWDRSIPPRGWQVLLAHLGSARTPFQPHKAST